jgi:hypothetical protein
MKTKTEKNGKTSQKEKRKEVECERDNGFSIGQKKRRRRKITTHYNDIIFWLFDKQSRNTHMHIETLFTDTRTRQG